MKLRLKLKKLMENTKDTIETLNDLVLINNDRIAGYEKALDELKSRDDLSSKILTSRYYLKQ
jgi:hypothetical protein